MKQMKRRASAIFGAVALLTVLFCTTPANATILTATDSNSSIKIDDASQSGMFNWTVDGVNQMFQQWFWYRIGAAGGESSIDTISASTSTTSAGGIVVDYKNPTGIEVKVTYTLTGGTAGSSTSDVAETIKIVNHGTSSMDLHFFQYSDFDLNGATGGQTVTFPNANTVDQSGPAGGVILSETVVTPPPSHHQGSLEPTILNSLIDSAPTTLSDNSGAGPGDVAWAFQWDQTIAAGGTFIISKDKNLRPSVPEPASVVLLGSLLIGITTRIRRRAKA